jgi:hypothetical protein
MTFTFITLTLTLTLTLILRPTLILTLTPRPHPYAGVGATVHGWGRCGAIRRRSAPHVAKDIRRSVPRLGGVEYSLATPQREAERNRLVIWPNHDI